MIIDHLITCFVNLIRDVLTGIAIIFGVGVAVGIIFLVVVLIDNIKESRSKKK